MKKTLTGAACIAVGFTVSAGANAGTSTTTYMAPQTTNVRIGPGTNYSLFATVAKGATITGVLQPSGWVRVTSPAADAGKYIFSGVLTALTVPVSTSGAPAAPTLPAPIQPAPMPPSSGSGTSSGSTITGWVASSDHPINVRSGPGFNYGISGYLAKKSKVSGTVSGDWIKVAGGYINVGLIETTNANIFDLNGYVPASALCAIPLAYNTPDPVSPNYTQTTARYLNCQAVKALNALEASYYASFGHYALIDLAYRSHAEEAYWANARPYAASPIGTSNHGWGLAIDFREIDDANDHEIKTGEFYWGQPGYKWIAANASKYGFAGDPVGYLTAYESYHWNFAG